jgi:hypothetical protein
MNEPMSTKTEDKPVAEDWEREWEGVTHYVSGGPELIPGQKVIANCGAEHIAVGETHPEDAALENECPLCLAIHESLLSQP